MPKKLGNINFFYSFPIIEIILIIFIILQVKCSACNIGIELIEGICTAQGQFCSVQLLGAWTHCHTHQVEIMCIVTIITIICIIAFDVVIAIITIFGLISIIQDGWNQLDLRLYASSTTGNQFCTSFQYRVSWANCQLY